jgi:hypothetical protein
MNTMHLHPSLRSGNRVVYLILATIPLFLGAFALGLGQDNSWDLRNYHYYNVFSYLNDRMGHDIAVAHVATYYNPLLHIPFYYAVNAWPPAVVGFILGALQGCNVFLLFAIGRRVIPFPKTSGGLWVCLAAALLGMLGATGIAETGTSFGDNVLSLLVLAAVWLIVRMDARVAASGKIAWGISVSAGLLAGAAFGLKLPFAVYAVGLCLAFFGLDLPWRRRLLLALIFGLGVLAGLALTGGFWMMEIWQRFENPLFPYFNQFFESRWAASGAYRDERFLPVDWIGALFFPLRFTLNPMLVSEVPFRDLRFAMLFLLLMAWLIKKALPTTAHPEKDACRDRTDPHAAALARFLIISVAVSFVLWMKLFGVYRYMIVCEMLAPIVMAVIITDLVASARRRAFWMVGSFVLIAATLQPANWGRGAWGADYFGVQAPALADAQNTVVLTSGYDPMAYMIPFFPRTVRFLRIHSYMTGSSSQPHAMDYLMQDVVAAHKGPLYALYRSCEEPAAVAALESYGLELGRGACRVLLPDVEPDKDAPFYFCKVAKPEPDATE